MLSDYVSFETVISKKRKELYITLRQKTSIQLPTNRLVSRCARCIPQPVDVLLPATALPLSCPTRRTEHHSTTHLPPTTYHLPPSTRHRPLLGCIVCFMALGPDAR